MAIWFEWAAIGLSWITRLLRSAPGYHPAPHIIQFIVVYPKDRSLSAGTDNPDSAQASSFIAISKRRFVHKE
jgi:hypothetical protein